MKKFVKKILVLSICGSFLGSSVNAATYQVIDKGAANSHKYTFAQQENNLGEMVILGTEAYNFSVQYQYLDEADFDSIVTLANTNHETVIDINNIEDEALLRAGTPTENDSFWAINYLKGLSANLGYQKYGDIAALINLNGDTEEVAIFDTFFEGTTELTRSTIDDINGITDNGWIFGSGSAPYLPLVLTNDQNTDDTADDVDSNYWVREFITRGFYSLDRGQTIIPLMAPESTYGGISAISDISESGIAIGYASTGISDEAAEFITNNCSTTEQLEDTPFIVCIDVVLRANGLTLNNLYSTQAFKWTINNSGAIEQSETLGYLISPHPDDERGLQSFAQSVNDSGTIVGYSDGWFANDVTDPEVDQAKSTYAVVFKDGNVFDINTNHEEFFRSRANDINNQDIVVGNLETLIGGSNRNVFYYADVSDVNNIEAVMPDSFFVGSSTTAKSINENGIIVGVAEIERSITTDGTARRTHGFMYEIATETLTDLNDFLTCNSNYTVIDAKSINDNNEISATALVKINAKDFFGNDILDENGTPIQEEVVRAVKLSPLNGGVVENCIADDEEETFLERQGAGLSWTASLLLLISVIRRKLYTL